MAFLRRQRTDLFNARLLSLNNKQRIEKLGDGDEKSVSFRLWDQQLRALPDRIERSAELKVIRCW